MAHIVVGDWAGLFLFNGSCVLGPGRGLPMMVVRQETYLALLGARVTVLTATRGPSSQQLRFTLWSGCGV